MKENARLPHPVVLADLLKSNIYTPFSTLQCWSVQTGGCRARLRARGFQKQIIKRSTSRSDVFGHSKQNTLLNFISKFLFNSEFRWGQTCCLQTALFVFSIPLRWSIVWIYNNKNSRDSFTLSASCTASRVQTTFGAESTQSCYNPGTASFQRTSTHFPLSWRTSQRRMRSQLNLAVCHHGRNEQGCIAQRIWWERGQNVRNFGGPKCHQVAWNMPEPSRCHIVLL